MFFATFAVNAFLSCGCDRISLSPVPRPHRIPQLAHNFLRRPNRRRVLIHVE
jgi:hypothetical protein